MKKIILSAIILILLTTGCTSEYKYGVKDHEGRAVMYKFLTENELSEIDKERWVVDFMPRWDELVDALKEYPYAAKIQINKINTVEYCYRNDGRNHKDYFSIIGATVLHKYKGKSIKNGQEIKFACQENLACEGDLKMPFEPEGEYYIFLDDFRGDYDPWYSDLADYHLTWHRDNLSSFMYGVYDSMKPFDFSITFNTYGKEKLDTFKGTITKDLVSKGTVSTEYEMSKTDKEKAFIMLMEMGIQDYPDILGDSSYISDSPVRHQLRITMGNEERLIIWADSSELSEDDELLAMQMKFLEFIEFIHNLVYDSDEYKALPERDGGYI